LQMNIRYLCCFRGPVAYRENRAARHFLPQDRIISSDNRVIRTSGGRMAAVRPLAIKWETLAISDYANNKGDMAIEVAR
jgi:hypothetical protein